MRVTGLDLSLTGSGIAQVNAVSDNVRAPVATVEEVGTKPNGDDLAARGHRLRGLASPILAACAGSDLVLIEDLYMGAGTGGQLDRAGLWWIVVNSLTARGVPVVAVTNNHLKMYALGKGAGKGTDKDYVLAAVVRRYPAVAVQSNNTADALVLAAMGSRYLGCPIDPDLPDTHTRAMKAVHWPSTTTR
jgi:crossover junction endodeoxyribonuclease RuvC